MAVEVERGPLHDPDRDYRVHVLATLKALAWLIFPAVFAVMFWSGAGEGIAGWLARGFLKGDEWKAFLTPLVWSTLAALIAVAMYSTLIKWTWDGWDHKVKYFTTAAEQEQDTLR